MTRYKNYSFWGGENNSKKHVRLLFALSHFTLGTPYEVGDTVIYCTCCPVRKPRPTKIKLLVPRHTAVTEDSSCAQSAVRSNRDRVWSRERFIAGPSKESRQLVFKIPPDSPKGFSNTFYKSQVCVSGEGGVAGHRVCDQLMHNSLTDGEVTGKCHRG